MQTNDSTVEKNAAITKYDQVPYFRRNWLVIIMALILPPVLLVILLTGDVFYEKKGELKTYSKGAKIFLIVWSSLYIIVRIFKALK